MSAASIDRSWHRAKASDAIKGKSTTKPSPLLRSSIKIRKAATRSRPHRGFRARLRRELRSVADSASSPAP